MTMQDDDWRLHGQEKNFHSNVFHWSRYTQPSATWDHDHCEFCWARFAEPAAEYSDAQFFGYTTEDRYNWICKTCFEELSDRLGLERSDAPQDGFEK